MTSHFTWTRLEGVEGGHGEVLRAAEQRRGEGPTADFTEEGIDRPSRRVSPVLGRVSVTAAPWLAFCG